jgi:hypothetical protein
MSELESVRDLNHLAELAQQKKAIMLVGGRFAGYCGRQNYQPAAWMLNLTGETLVRMIPHMKVYKSNHARNTKKDCKDSKTTTEATAAQTGEGEVIGRKDVDKVVC